MMQDVAQKTSSTNVFKVSLVGLEIFHIYLEKTENNSDPPNSLKYF